MWHSWYLIGFRELPEASLQVMEVLLPLQDIPGIQRGQDEQVGRPEKAGGQWQEGQNPTAAPIGVNGFFGMGVIYGYWEF